MEELDEQRDGSSNEDASDSEEIEAEDDSDLGSTSDDIDLGLTKDQLDQLDAALDGDDDDDADLHYDESFVSPQLDFEEKENSNELSSHTPEQTAFLDGLDESIARILKYADELASRREDGNEAMDQEWILTRVLSDAFHVMDQVKVPTWHDFKAAYFRALRAAMFVMDSGDLKRVKKVLAKKGRKFSHVMAFQFSYIALHVKRKILPLNILYQ
jgi:hypothetical protein